jgi:hypothetical protein
MDVQQALVKALTESEKSANEHALKAGELRQAAWIAFEAALFEPSSQSS